MTTKNLLLTGTPGCGKTTVIQAVIERLQDFRLAGFYTAEIREKGQRVGFEAVGLRGGRTILAHVGSSSRICVGRYGVEIETFEKLLGEELETQPAQAFIIDEIGKMECFSQRFVSVVRSLLDNPIPVLATVALKGSGLIAEVKARSDIKLVKVTSANRNELPAKIAGELKELIHAYHRHRADSPD